ncbi:MAG: hypothetical protein OXL38_09845 [Gammaproteobacteria bacterium]|nr:hypothetical protein [Gammaproteobacteria bacterium]
MVDVVAFDAVALSLGTRGTWCIESAVCRRGELWAREGLLVGFVCYLIPTLALLWFCATQRAGRQTDFAFSLPACIHNRTFGRLHGGTSRLLEQLPHPLPGNLASERVDGLSQFQSQIIRRVLVTGL